MSTLLSSLETQARRVLLEKAALASPSAPVISNLGTPGLVAYSYKVVAINATGTTDASAAGSTATGATTLTGVNFNRITWTAVAQATGYWIFRTVGGATQGRIATVGAVTTWDDTGLTGDASTAPITNTTGLNSPFWSSEELIDICNKGIKDLWGALIDLHQEHYQTMDTSNVSLAADSDVLAGVPTDVFRVLLIEPADVSSSGAYRGLQFVPRDYNSEDFKMARAQGSVTGQQSDIVYYTISQAGAPVGAPTIRIAPKFSSAIAAGSLRLVYIPIIADKVSSDANPIPSESDQALIAWIIAFAKAKGREDGAPDPGWIAVYATEKQAILTRSTPRQEQEPDVVESMFGGQ